MALRRYMASCDHAVRDCIMYNNAFVDVVMEEGLVSIALIAAVSTSVNGWVVFLAQLLLQRHGVPLKLIGRTHVGTDSNFQCARKGDLIRKSRVGTFYTGGPTLRQMLETTQLYTPVRPASPLLTVKKHSEEPCIEHAYSGLRSPTSLFTSLL